MLTLDATQAALVAADNKTASWTFRITDSNGVIYVFASEPIGGVVWATGISWDSGITWDTGENLSGIVLMNFSGITLRRNTKERRIIAPSETSFEISNPDNTMTASDFRGGDVLIELYLSNPTLGERKIAGWKFRIKTAEPGYQKICLRMEDFLQHYLRGYYPNARYPEDIFPSTKTYAIQGLCVPVPFGTAYVPLRDVYINPAVSVTAITISAWQSASGSICTIEDSAAGLGEFYRGDQITVSGFTESENNGTFTALKTSTTVLQFLYDTGIVTEAAGDSVTLTAGRGGFFVLGDPAYTYTISKVCSPRAGGQKSEYSSASYTFTQSTMTDSNSVDWRVFRAIIADANKDGTADSPGSWGGQGGVTLDPAVQFTRSDTATMTGPEDVLEFVLEDMGVPSANIDDVTFAAAGATYTGWGLEYNGAFWYSEDRQKVLATLLTMCHSCLHVGEKVELHVLSKTSQKSITAAEILRSQPQGDGSFRYREITDDNYTDSGYVTWQQSGQPQDEFLKLLISADAAANVVSSEVVECPFVQDSQDVQRIGKLHFQRKLQREAEVTFIAKGTCLALQPDDIITINADNYGGTYTVLIDSMKINKDISIEFICSKYTNTFSDWGDLAPSAITIPSDTTAYTWQPTISGPQTDKDLGKSAFDMWGKEYLPVGPTTNAGKYTDIQKAINAVEAAGSGAIYLLNGTYALTAPLYLPDINIEIVGQSQGGVIIQNAAGENGIVLYNLTKTFKLSNFTLSSQNTDSYTKLLYIYGSAAANNTCNVLIDGILFELVDDGTAASTSGDDGIYLSTGQTGSTVVNGCRFSAGKRGIYCGSVENLIASNNIFLNSQYAAIHYTGASTKNASIKGNIITDFEFNGILTSVQDLIIDGNQLTCMTSAPSGSGIIGIAIDEDRCQVINNIIKIVNTNNASYKGISTTASGTNVNSLISKNQIAIQITSTGAASGIYATASDQSIIGNPIVLENTDHTTAAYGINSTGDRNIIAGNHINMLNDANDIGINLPAGADNNQGGDNVTYNVGTSIADAGAGNAVTGKDV